MVGSEVTKRAVQMLNDYEIPGFVCGIIFLKWLTISI